MLERSSQAGCVQSSYLLWEHKRRGAVSLLLHFEICNLGIWFLSVVKKIWLVSLLIFRWLTRADTSSAYEPSGTMLGKDAGKHRCVIWKKGKNIVMTLLLMINPWVSQCLCATVQIVVFLHFHFHLFTWTLLKHIQGLRIFAGVTLLPCDNIVLNRCPFYDSVW